jgi:hypothetical protein
MRDFFGLGDGELPAGLVEEDLFALYRTKLKAMCGLQHAADLAIPHPIVERTKFRLVLGAKRPAAIELFRDIEKKVIGSEAAVVRDDASTRKARGHSGQLKLLDTAPPVDARYDSLHAQGQREAPRLLAASLTGGGAATFGSLWPALLEALHITKTELAQIAWGLAQKGVIEVTNKMPLERTMKDDHILRSPTPR